VGMFLLVKSETPMFLISQKRFIEAKTAIDKFVHHSEDKEAVFEYLKKNTSKETNIVTYKEVITSPKYRRQTWILFILAISMMFNSVTAITSFGVVIL
jgi:hypothetical protein